MAKRKFLSLGNLCKVSLFGLVGTLFVAIAYEATKPLPLYNKCVIMDANSDHTELMFALDNPEWQDVIDMYLAGEAKFIGGKLVESDNRWGFSFDPSTLLVNESADELPDKTVAGTLLQIKECSDRWLGCCYVNATVLSIKERAP